MPPERVLCICDLVGIEACAVLLIGNIALGIGHNIVICLDDAACFAGEGAFALRIGALLAAHHRLGAVAEVVGIDECRGAHCDADAVFCVAVEIVIINMYGAGADARMTGIRMVIPVVVVGDAVLGRFGLHALQIALAVIPEVVVAVGDEARGFGIECAVALCLIGIGACVAVEQVAVVHPDMVIVLLQTDIIAFAAVAVHEADVAHLDVRGVCNAQTEAVEYGIRADAFNRDTAGNALVCAAALEKQVAVHQSCRIGDVADAADIERTGIGALLVGGQDVLDAGDFGLAALAVRDNIERDLVLGILCDIQNDSAVFQGAVIVIGTGCRAADECKAAAVMRLDGDLLLFCLAGILFAVHHRHNLDRVAAGFQSCCLPSA